MMGVAIRGTTGRVCVRIINVVWVFRCFICVSSEGTCGQVSWDTHIKCI